MVNRMVMRLTLALIIGTFISCSTDISVDEGLKANELFVEGRIDSLTDILVSVRRMRPLNYTPADGSNPNTERLKWYVEDAEVLLCQPNEDTCLSVNYIQDGVYRHVLTSAFASAKSLQLIVRTQFDTVVSDVLDRPDFTSQKVETLDAFRVPINYSYSDFGDNDSLLTVPFKLSSQSSFESIVFANYEDFTQDYTGNYPYKTLVKSKQLPTPDCIIHGPQNLYQGASISNSCTSNGTLSINLAAYWAFDTTLEQPILYIGTATPGLTRYTKLAYDANYADGIFTSITERPLLESNMSNGLGFTTWIRTKAYPINF